MRTFAFVLLKTLANSWYSGGILERSEDFVIFAELAWISEEWKQSWNLLEPRSFDAYINTAVPMITILDYLKIDIEVSNADIETAEPNNCREISEDNRDTNGVLAMM